MVDYISVAGRAKMAGGPRGIAVPWILGLYSLAGTAFIVAARMAGWYGGSESKLLLLPFAAVLGGLTQLLAGMWAFEAADGLATAMLGTWGSFWIGYGILNALFVTGKLAEPTGRFTELGFWFIPLACITWMGAVAATAESAALVVTLAFLAVGSTVAAIGEIASRGGLMMFAGWLFIIAAVFSWYTATALMLESAFGRPVLPVGRHEAWGEVPAPKAVAGDSASPRSEAPVPRRAG